MRSRRYRIERRLEEVLFLIQHLGLKAYSLEDGSAPDGTVPHSATNWTTLARDHPEFFRVPGDSSVVLSMRFYQEGSESRPRLDIDQVQKLVENAIALDERQQKRSEVWKVWATLIAATTAAVAGFTAAVTSVVQLYSTHK
jgi:hypothetical protein